MKTFFILLALISIFHLDAFDLTPEEAEWLEYHPVIRIAPDPEFPPIEWFDENNQYCGIAAEFMELLGKKLGIRFEVVRCRNWDEVLRKAQNREVDLLPAAAQTPARAEYMLFSEPHLIFPGVIITKKHNTELNSSRKLYGKKVGIVSGYVWHEFFLKDHPQVEIMAVENITAGLRKLSTDEIDAFIATLPIALYYIEQEGIHNLIVSGETEYKTRLSILTRKDWPVLHTIISKALNSISPEQKKEIINKWITLKPASIFETRTFRIILFSILAGIVLFVLIAFVWNASLQKQVKLKTQELQQDIARRMELETELKKSEEKYKLLIENQIDLVVKSDRQGNILFVSPSFCRTFGRSEEELLGKNILLLVHPEDLEKTKSALKSLFSPPHTYYIELKAAARDGWRWFAWQCKAISENQGNDGEIIGLGRDITRQKEMELENHRLAEIIRNSKEGIILTDAVGNIQFVNAALVEMSGYTLDELLNKDPISLVVADDQSALGEEIRTTVRIRDHWSGEMICKRKNGEHYPIETQVFAIRNEAGEIASIAAIQHDITERRKTEKELENYRNHLIEQVKMRTQELEEKNRRLEEFNKLFIGREFRIKELRMQVKDLEEKLREK